MTILQMIREWRRGCTCGPLGLPNESAGPGPEGCQECTRALIDAIEHRTTAEHNVGGTIPSEMYANRHVGERPYQSLDLLPAGTVSYERDEREKFTPLVSGTITATFDSEELLRKYEEGMRRVQSNIASVVSAVATQQRVLSYVDEKPIRLPSPVPDQRHIMFVPEAGNVCLMCGAKTEKSFTLQRQGRDGQPVAPDIRAVFLCAGCIPSTEAQVEAIVGKALGSGP